jgi:tetratricopeptide (TPR) repeat protein
MRVNTELKTRIPECAGLGKSQSGRTRRRNRCPNRCRNFCAARTRGPNFRTTCVDPPVFAILQVVFRAPLALAALLLACACASGGPPPKQPRKEAPVTLVPRLVITRDDASDIPELYDRAVELGRAGQHSQAARAFDRIVALDPDGPLADDALFQSGAEYDLAAELELSARRYEDLARRYPQSPLARPALARGIRVLSHLEAWPRAGLLARSLLVFESELGPFDRVAAYAAAALDSLERDDEQGAVTFIERGRTLIDERGLDAVGRITRELGALYFALGELRRRRAARIQFDPLPPDFPQVLERRCQLLLDAQSAYSDAMRAHDAHWSTMAGVRVGELYQGLHRDLMRVPMPQSADTPEKRQLFEGALRLRYAVLLHTALRMIEHTLTMAERTGERSAWVDRGRAARAAVQNEVRAEEAALAKLPFSKQTLEAALEELGRRHQPK